MNVLEHYWSIEKTERPIKNGQSRNTGISGDKPQREDKQNKTNKQQQTKNKQTKKQNKKQSKQTNKQKQKTTKKSRLQRVNTLISQVNKMLTILE